MRPLILLSFVSLSLGSSASFAVDYFPFAEGVVREYSYTTNAESGTYTNYFSGTIEVNGTTARILHYVGDWSGGLQQYWSENLDGDKLFHGFKLAGGFEVIWTPPLVWLDMPLTVGKTWETQAQGSGGETVNVHIEVLSAGDVTVPAGTYSALTIEWSATGTISKGHLVTGVPLQANGSSVEQVGELNSYADGTGQLNRILPSITEELLSVGVVAVEQVTWSTIRGLYR